MSNTYTPNTKMAMPAIGDTGWAVPVNGNTTLLDALAPVGGLAVSMTEVPSASLDVAVAAGNFANSWGSVVSYAGAASQAVSPSTTTYLWLDGSGTLHTGVAFPTGSFYVPLASVLAGTSTITSITDRRIVCGAVNAQSQPTLGAATAGATYTAAEQAMLQAVYNAVRSLGLGT